MSPDEAFKLFSPYMWEVEMKEVFEYKAIYFFPIEERKK
jgi:dual specificity tyrosine-phosphorylation-regulated kinase 2/3/4